MKVHKTLGFHDMAFRIGVAIALLFAATLTGCSASDGGQTVSSFRLPGMHRVAGPQAHVQDALPDAQQHLARGEQTEATTLPSHAL